MKIVIFFALLLFFLIIFLTVYFLIGKKLHKRLELQEERITKLSSTEEGRKILEKENEISEKKHKKYLKISSIIYFFVYFLFLFLGIYGTYTGIEKLKNGINFKDFVFMDKGFYLFSPFILVGSIIYLVNVIREIKNKNT